MAGVWLSLAHCQQAYDPSVVGNQSDPIIENPEEGDTGEPKLVLRLDWLPETNSRYLRPTGGYSKEETTDPADHAFIPLLEMGLFIRRVELVQGQLPVPLLLEKQEEFSLDGPGWVWLSPGESRRLLEVDYLPDGNYTGFQLIIAAQALRVKARLENTVSDWQNSPWEALAPEPWLETGEAGEWLIFWPWQDLTLTTDRNWLQSPPEPLTWENTLYWSTGRETGSAAGPALFLGLPDAQNPPPPPRSDHYFPFAEDLRVQYGEFSGKEYRVRLHHPHSVVVADSHPDEELTLEVGEDKFQPERPPPDFKVPRLWMHGEE